MIKDIDFIEKELIEILNFLTLMTGQLNTIITLLAKQVYGEKIKF